MCAQLYTEARQAQLTIPIVRRTFTHDATCHAQVPEITATELQGRLGATTAIVVVDVREPDERKVCIHYTQGCLHGSSGMFDSQA